MKGFLFGKFTGEFEGGLDVLVGQIIFLPDLAEGHSAREAPDHQSDGHARRPNGGLAIAGGRVNDDAVSLIHHTGRAFHTMAGTAIPVPGQTVGFPA